MPLRNGALGGGMLTNFPTIRKAVKKMATIDKMLGDGTFDNFSKREKLQIARQRAKLEKEPRLYCRPDASSGCPVRHRRTEGGQRRKGRPSD